MPNKFRIDTTPEARAEAKKYLACTLIAGTIFAGAALFLASAVDYRQENRQAQIVTCGGLRITIQVDKQYPNDLACEAIKRAMNKTKGE